MFYVAKLIQALGVAQVTVALVIGVSQEDSLARELELMVVGAVIFYLGRLVERRASA